jgi:hypothetical protein
MWIDVKDVDKYYCHPMSNQDGTVEQK